MVKRFKKAISSVSSAPRSTSVLYQSLLLLPKTDKHKIIMVIFIQIGLGLLDLLAVAFIGVLGALSISGVQSRQTGSRVNQFLDFIQISNYSFQMQAGILGSLAALFLVLRTIISMILLKRTNFFLARRAAQSSSELFAKLINQNILDLNRKSLQENLFAVTEGIRCLIIGIIGNLVLLISDSMLLIVMFGGLLVFDPVMAFLTLVGFGIVALILFKLMSIKANNLGRNFSRLSVESNELILQTLQTYRENNVKGRRFYLSKKVELTRFKIADSYAELAFMPYISKYVIESSLVVGGLLISASQFLLKDAVHAIATLTIFIAAGSRIAPAILRIQQGAISIKGNIGSAEPTLDLIRCLEFTEPITDIHMFKNFRYKDFYPNVEVEELSLTYPHSSEKALEKISLNIPAGSSFAIVGSSGAGKTTLVDCILGLIKPDVGKILISRKNPDEVYSKWPGAVAYVPQEVFIAKGTIRENITLGYPINFFDDSDIWHAIKQAKLEDMVENLSQGINSEVGEFGNLISGGQRQRLGIARALITRPKLLVLDEATSSLDSQMEFSITDSLKMLEGDVTIITIAHRLSTVRNSSQVAFLEKGKVLGIGTFDEVRKKVPNFDSQAKLMGL